RRLGGWVHQLGIQILHSHSLQSLRSRVTVTATLAKSAGIGAWGLLTLTCTDLIRANWSRIASAIVAESVSIRFTDGPVIIFSTTAATCAYLTVAATSSVAAAWLISNWQTTSTTNIWPVARSWSNTP